MESRSIVVGTDFSESSLPALETAFELAQERRADLHLVHVLDLPTETRIGFEAVDLDQQLHEDLEVRLLELVPANYPPDLTVKAVIRSGDPPTEIGSAAQQSGADLIVVGTHGRKGLSRLLMGSTAEALLRSAPCRVLVAKPHVHLHPQAPEVEKEVSV